MKTDLLSYLTQRYYKDERSKTEPGPVITISREYGCPAKDVAAKLSEVLNNKMIVKGEKPLWRWISKEILNEVARELEMDPEEIRYVFEYERKGIFDDILKSHSQKYYKNDKRIRNTIGKVIRSLGVQGHIIIVGRAGVVLTKDIPRSLHVNLEAPLEWRALRTSEKKCMTIEQARKYALDMDRKRREFREYYAGKDTDYTRYDVTFNCMTLSVGEIVDALLKIAELRKLI